MSGVLNLPNKHRKIEAIVVLKPWNTASDPGLRSGGPAKGHASGLRPETGEIKKKHMGFGVPRKKGQNI